MVSDPYLDPTRSLNRLIDEYHKYGKLIIAFDFDDTVYDTHKNDWQYDRVISLLQELKRLDAGYFICWSASPPTRYPMMKNHFEQKGIPCDAINENAPWIEDRGRKIYANIYVDDRSGLPWAYAILNTLVETLKEEKEDGV